MANEKKFIITESQRTEVITALLEMQAKFSFNVLQIMGTLPEVPEVIKVKK